MIIQYLREYILPAVLIFGMFLIPFWALYRKGKKEARDE